MKEPMKPGADAAELRRLAEERLKSLLAESRGPPSEIEVRRLLHELQVHQIELELQNEELRDTRAELEAALANYTDLYDFAPTGYFTLARDGTILAVNLTGAKLAGVERAHLLKQRMHWLIAESDRHLLTTLLDQVFSKTAAGSCEVRFQGDGAASLFVRIDARGSVGGLECRAAVSDVTERHHVEVERDQLVKHLQEAAAQIKVLRGFLPICSYCKKIRDDGGYWEQLETYISEHSEALFSHGICPVCMKEHYPDFTQ